MIHANDFAATEDEPKCAHRFHDMQFYVASDWDICGENTHVAMVLHSTHRTPHHSEEEGYSRNKRDS